MRILVAPASTRFSPEAGSEDGWVYDIVAGVAAMGPNCRFTCIAEQAAGPAPEGVRVIAIGKRRTQEIGGLLLPLRVARAAKVGGLLDKVDVVHHALPFAIGRSFSLLALRARKLGLPLVIGPLQSPLQWVGPDEVGRELVSGGPRPVQKVATAVAQATWPAAKTALSQLSARTLCQADRVVVISEHARALVESAGVAPHKTELIPPPMRVPPRPPGTRSSRPGPLRLVTAGYLIERKGVCDIVAAVAALATAGEELLLEVAGDGPAAPALRNQARDLGVGGAISFRGWLSRPELAGLLKDAHAYVSMSRAESWGQAVADALASGLVVISADNEGARSMAALGAPLRLVPSGDPRRLADELRRLCHTPRNILGRDGDAGALWATEHLTRAVIAGRWAELYGNVLDQAKQLKQSGHMPAGVTHGRAIPREGM